MAQVTIETLRHYDRVGLLKPAKVDPFTGYRLYSAKQLQPLNRILTLKELGFSLEEIARILQGGLTDEQLRGMLKMQLTRTQSDLQAVQLRQEKIVACLNQLNLEDDMSVFDVTLKPVEKCTIVAIREVVPTAEEMPERCEAMFNKIASWMTANQIPFGPICTIYYNESYSRINIDTECAFMVPNGRAAHMAPTTPPIMMRELEAVPLMATTIVTYEFFKKVDGLTPAYQALGKWIEDNDYSIAGPPRELFHGCPGSEDFTAEIQFPVKK